MARERRPERDLAFELFRKSKGRLEVKEIAKKLNVKAATVSQWKYRLAGYCYLVSNTYLLSC